MCEMARHFFHFFKIELGIRQGSVLSPFLFALYLDEIVDHRVNGIHNFVILYAADILLLSSSLSDLQRRYTVCETELPLLDMTINAKKSCCLHIGSRFEVGELFFSSVSSPFRVTSPHQLAHHLQ
jgi:hypothetical protein